jgi:hypothetical protein
MSDAHRFKVIGLCILAAFPLFGVGQALLGSEWHWLGLLMCLSNSVAVITIGLLMRPITADTVAWSGWAQVPDWPCPRGMQRESASVSLAMCWGLTPNILPLPFLFLRHAFALQRSTRLAQHGFGVPFFNGSFRLICLSIPHGFLNKTWRHFAFGPTQIGKCFRCLVLPGWGFCFPSESELHAASF